MFSYSELSLFIGVVEFCCSFLSIILTGRWWAKVLF